jgi:hypothetical protein
MQNFKNSYDYYFNPWDIGDLKNALFVIQKTFIMLISIGINATTVEIRSEL